MTIIAQQHDVNQINVGTVPQAGKPSDGLRRQLDFLRGDGGWDAAEYGITREAQIAKLEGSLARAEAYEATPEGIEASRLEVERTFTEMKQRAIGRAKLDTTGGRVRAFFAGKPAWHGLGVTVDQATTSSEAIQLAGLNWPVKKKMLKYYWEGKEYFTEDTFAIIREDTGGKLGTVGTKYEPIQNADGFNFLDEVLASYGAKYETAGSIRGGQQVWILAHMPNRFEPQPGDVVEPYVLFSNCHDGSGAAWCLPTTVRVECANTQRIAMQGSRAKALSIRHTGDVRAKIADAKAALGLATAAMGKYQEAAVAMVSAKIEIGSYANNVLDAAMEVTAADALKGAAALAAALRLSQVETLLAEKAFGRKIKQRSDALADIMERYETSRCTPRGSIWAAFNAVTEHADHRQPRKLTKDLTVRAERRFESLLIGSADDLKQVAYEFATLAI